MNIVYLQCDMRYNSNLLMDFDETTIIGYVIKKISELKNINVIDNIVCEVFDCDENVKLIDYLKNENNVDVYVSSIENITKRLIKFCQINNINGYIIRVLGEQVLINNNYVKYILSEMSNGNYDYYFSSKNDGQVPEVFKADILINNEKIIGKYSRYYYAYNEIVNLNQFSFKYDAMPVRIVASDKHMIQIIKNTYLNGGINELNEIVCDSIYKILNSDTYLTKRGYFQSVITSQILDSNMKPQPWWTIPCIDFIEDRLNKNMNVFEFGCGYSTFFLSKRVNHIISIEHDAEWFNNVYSNKPDNVEIKYIKMEYDGDYCKSILDYNNEFDIICIDGRDRANCAINSIKALKSSGVIIFDDAIRTQYSKAYDYLQEAGFKRIDFRGLILSGINTLGMTSIFYRPNNCLDI